ncbi:hypothetical protein BXZ70DRAFT_47307 [Cristinia sonorae]|uniref:Protein PBN1 n=1 Tax=Cristinia sonorae TaxID=1940300 RepID=A0A8K0V174_9AGAR|nr:hypothetical protein BXZ70DRAFT_47307 [Cristinia sonorae]
MTSSQPVLLSSRDDDKGYHFKYTTRLSSPNEPNCSIHLRYLFPPDIYVDPYELQDQLRHPFWLNDTINLEHPVGTSDTLSWTELQVSLVGSEKPDPLIVIPLHTRYGKPTESRVGYITLPQPLGLWRCPLSDTHSPLSSTLFPKNGVHGGESNAIRVPLGLRSHIDQVELGTAVVVTAAFLYLLSVFYTTTHRLYASGEKTKRN